MIYKVLPVVLICALIMACSKSEVEDVDRSRFGYDYAPFRIGSEWVYQQDSILFDPEPGGLVIDTVSEQVRMLVVDSFINASGESTYRIERFLRKDDTSAWKIQDVWAWQSGEYEFVSTEENLAFVKLAFPIKVGTSWNGNRRINTSEVRVDVRGESMDFFKFWQNYEIQQVDDNVVINGNPYDDVITVVQADKEILIEKRLSVERYARNVGLVYKRLEILDTQNIDTSIPFHQRAERGFILDMRLHSYSY